MRTEAFPYALFRMAGRVLTFLVLVALLAFLVAYGFDTLETIAEILGLA